MHYWGDEDFDFDLFDKAIREVMDTWRTWGRIGTHGKEKYGTFRDHVYFYNAWWPIMQLIHPGYVRYTGPEWFYKTELLLGSIVQKLQLYRPINWYQRIVYNYAIQRACKKYPQFTDELVSHLDGYELVKPGIFGKINGQTIHDKYWEECK